MATLNTTKYCTVCRRDVPATRILVKNASGEIEVDVTTLSCGHDD
jgi:hypothetical protein